MDITNVQIGSDCCANRLRLPANSSDCLQIAQIAVQIGSDCLQIAQIAMQIAVQIGSGNSIYLCMDTGVNEYIHL